MGSFNEQNADSGITMMLSECHSLCSGSNLFLAVCHSVMVLQVGIAVVGLSSVLAGHGGSQVVSSEEMVTGMALIVASQVHHPLLSSVLPRELSKYRSCSLVCRAGEGGG